LLKKLFNINPGEGLPTLILFIYFFAFVAISITGSAARDAYFLNMVDRDYLPLMFLAVAIVLTLVIEIYSRLSKNRDLIQTTTISGLVFAFSLVFIQNQLEGWVIPFLYVWMEVITVITITQFWILAADVFNPRQAKRLFSLLGAGGALASIIIGSSINYYVSLFGSENLLFVTIGFLGVVILMANLIRPYRNINELKNHSTKKDEKQQSDKLFTPYLKSLTIIIGLGVNLAAFGFHIWLPYAHGSAPTPISALLSPAMIGIGAYALFRLIVEFLPQTYADLSIWLTIWGVATMFYGGAMALMQDDIKRVFAYSSISQMGYLLFGIGSISVLGLAGAEMMYVSHALGKGLLFMSAGIIIVQVGTRSLSKLGGLGSKLPITAVCAVIGALTIMGVPPTSGFMGEWMLFYGVLETALEEGNDVRSLMFALGLVATVLTMSYMLWMLKRVFFGKLPENFSKVKEGSWYMLSPMMVLAGFTIVLGIYPDIFLSKIMPYMQGVLGG